MVHLMSSQRLTVNCGALVTELKESHEKRDPPYGLVRKPPSVTVLVAVGKGRLQLTRRGDGRRVLSAHPLGVSEGQGVTVGGSAVMKEHAWSGGRREKSTLEHSNMSTYERRKHQAAWTSSSRTDTSICAVAGEYLHQTATSENKQFHLPTWFYSLFFFFFKIK